MFKAFCAFYNQLFTTECEHRNIVMTPPGRTPGAAVRKGGYCPDCGYKVQLMWTFCRCRTCGSKRIPKKTLDGKIAPMYRYCQHCGGTEHQLIKREKVHAHEMMYAISTKEIDYSEDRLPVNPFKFDERSLRNPYTAASTRHVVDGEVLGQEYV